MQKFIAWVDEIAETDNENKLARRLERIAFVFLVLMVLSAPHSIAATQTAWISGMFALVVRLFVKPRRKLVRTPLDAPLLAFFLWSVVTAFTSYAPDISLDKLRGVGLFLIFYFVVNLVRNRRAAVFLAFALVFSCMFNVIWTPIERLIGRGVEIHGVSAESPLTKTIYLENNNEKVALKDGDAVLEVNKKKIHSPEELLAALEANETSSLKFYRPDYYLNVQIKRADLLPGANALERLGFADWKKSRNWRSMGFYGHWTTYAEVLQLIASLVFGLFIASMGKKDFLSQRYGSAEKEENINEYEEAENSKERNNKYRFSRLFNRRATPILLFCLAAMMLALLLNVTRASQLAFLVSAISIVLLAGNRRLILLSAAIILPVVVGGLVFLQQSRNVGFFDREDDSTKYRQTVYREGLALWTNNARHFAVGIGMDSIKRYAKDWHLFDDGRLPMGHFHSTPLQLVVERGFPALLLWLWILGVYARTLLRGVSSFKFQVSSSTTENRQPAIGDFKSSDWQTRGILLGCFGGLIGFFTSGLVHYNLGDAEVAMVFFLLMGIGVSLVMKNGK